MCSDYDNSYEAAGHILFATEMLLTKIDDAEWAIGKQASTITDLKQQMRLLANALVANYVFRPCINRGTVYSTQADSWISWAERENQRRNKK